MKYASFALLLLISNALFSQNLAFRSKITYPSQNLANVWGYTAGGHEYALVGAYNQTSIVDITNPDAPFEVTTIPGPSSGWKEIKTFGNYAYVVSEGGWGLQIINLTNLPNTNLSNHSYYGDGAINGLLTKGHALHIDAVKGYLYIYGSNLNGGRPLYVNLNTDPYNPTYAGYFNFIGYGHDGYVNNDTMFCGHISAGMFSIGLMTNKTMPELLGSQTTPDAYTHNTWRSGNTLFTTDEKSNAYLAAYDITDPTDIQFLDKIRSNPGSGSIVHNTYIKNNYAVTSWYKDGITLVDVSRPSNMVQVGAYDTYTGSGNGFEGCWGVYPYFPSGTIIASNIRASGTNDGELFVLTPTYVRGCYIECTITDAETLLPINGATVQLLTTSTSELTNGTGEYKMGQRLSGTYTAQVSKTGFITYTTSVTLTNGVVTVLNAALTRLVLPVEMEQFEVAVEKNTAILSWKTALEVQNSGFEIEHRQEQGPWESIGFVATTALQGGGANYTFTVENLADGMHYFRLRQVDRDGSTTVSDIQEALVKTKGFTAVLEPSAVDQETRLRIKALSEGPLEIAVITASGYPAGFAWKLTVQQDMEIPLNMAELPAGFYFLEIKGAGEVQVLRFWKG